MKRLTNEWDIGGYGNEIWLRKNDQKINFEIQIKTKEGVIFAMYINRELPTHEVYSTGADYRMKVNINKAHTFLGHTNEDETRAAAKEL